MKNTTKIIMGIILLILVYFVFIYDFGQYARYQISNNTMYHGGIHFSPERLNLLEFLGITSVVWYANEDLSLHTTNYAYWNRPCNVFLPKFCEENCDRCDKTKEYQYGEDLV